MVQHVRTQRTARLVQKALGEVFVSEASRLLDNIIVTVTEVQMSPDLGTAHVYLGFALNPENADGLTRVEQQKGTLKRLLSTRVGRHLRRVPELRFYTDYSAAHAAKIRRLLDSFTPQAMDPGS